LSDKAFFNSTCSSSSSATTSFFFRSIASRAAILRAAGSCRCWWAWFGGRSKAGAAFSKSCFCQL